MPTWEQFTDFVDTVGVSATVLVFIGIFMWRYGARYITSVEKLHDGIGEKMGSQQTLCAQHGKLIATHDASMRDAAMVAFSFVQAFVEREFPASKPDADDAFEKLRRIMGEQ
jgi:hypothetical protein